MRDFGCFLNPFEVNCFKFYVLKSCEHLTNFEFYKNMFQYLNIIIKILHFLEFLGSKKHLECFQFLLPSSPVFQILTQILHEVLSHIFLDLSTTNSFILAVLISIFFILRFQVFILFVNLLQFPQPQEQGHQMLKQFFHLHFLSYKMP